MNRSSIDGYPVTYISAGEEIPPAELDGLRSYEFRHDAAAFDRPRLRRAILEMPMKSGPWRYFGVVHWSDGTDLEELDRRARAGDDLTGALEGGIFCDVRNVQCLVCHTNHLVAVPDGGKPIVTPDRQRAHEFSSTCPTCGNTDYIRHAELFADG